MSDRMLTMAEAVREAMTIAFEERPEVFLLGEDVGIYGGAFAVSYTHLTLPTNREV